MTLNADARGLFRRFRTVANAIVLGIAVSTSIADPLPPPPALKVLVLRDSPFMSYRNAERKLIGFNVDLAHLLCAHIKVRCEVEESLLSEVVDQVSQGYGAFSTVSLEPTVERQKKVLFTEPVMYGRSFWFSKKLLNDSAQFRVAAVAGSTQYKWAERSSSARQWMLVPVDSNADVSRAMLDGRADAGVLPFTTALSFIREGKLGAAGFTVFQSIEESKETLSSAIAVDPKKPELWEALNRVVRQIKQNGELDKLNSKHFPIRVL